MFEPHQVSRYFDKRRKYSDCQARKSKKHRPRNANRLRASTNKRMPKLSLAVQASSHLILAACPSIGMGSDHRQFHALLHGASRRVPLELMLADKGYDSEANHRLARQTLGIQSLIPPRTLRPGATELTGYYRRLMRRRLKKGKDKKRYRQRWQIETVNSMIKRNLGSACRARSGRAKKKDLLLRVLTHNLMILANYQG
jgi:hypothetical protein